MIREEREIKKRQRHGHETKKGGATATGSVSVKWGEREWEREEGRKRRNAGWWGDTQSATIVGRVHISLIFGLFSD